VNPAFKVSFLQKVLAPIVVEKSHTLFKGWNLENPINLQESFSKITMDVIGIAGFGHDFQYTEQVASSSVSDMVLNVLEEPNLRAVNPLRPYYELKAGWNYHRHLREFKALGRHVIELARKQKKEQDYTSILDLLLSQSDLSNEDLLNEVMTFLFAGKGLSIPK
jgi:cytochrome P450